MSYEKHTWQTGETITAEKLNNLEDGVASNGGDVFFIVEFVEGTESNKPIADKTTTEIINAMNSGKMVIGHFRVSINETLLIADNTSFINYDTGVLSCIFNGKTCRTNESSTSYEWTILTN